MASPQVGPSREGKRISEAQKQMKNFSLANQRSDIVRTLEVYKLLCVVGEGTYGVVYRAVDIRNNRRVAVKDMHIDPDNQGLPSVALREISFLGELEHKNIVNLLDVLIAEKSLMLIFEFLDMDLREYQVRELKKKKHLEYDLVRRFMYQMLEGLAYIHSRHVVHRDLKPQNVLVDTTKLILKIGDFGLARVYTKPLREMTNEVVTLWYRAPELLLGADFYDTAVDMWSMGVMMIELIENDPPFDPDCEIRALHMIFQAVGTPSAQTWPDFANQKHYCDVFPKWSPTAWTDISPRMPIPMINLLKRLLVSNPDERVTCIEAMQFPLFEEERHSISPTNEPSDQPPNYLSPRTMFAPSPSTSSHSDIWQSS